MLNNPKTIIIIDDHDIVRKGLKELIETMGDYKIIGEYNNGLAFVKALSTISEMPDLFILDYSMPIMNGVEVIQEVVKTNEDLKFLILTQHFDEDIINAVYQNGARGFLHKTCTKEQLSFTIDNIIKYGYSNISEILKRIRNIPDDKPRPATTLPLTERELQLIELVCDEAEHTYQSIADIMSVSIKTVDKYRGQLFAKLNVKSKLGIVLYSHKYKLTKPFIDS